MIYWNKNVTQFGLLHVSYKNTVMPIVVGFIFAGVAGAICWYYLSCFIMLPHQQAPCQIFFL